MSKYKNTVIKNIYYMLSYAFTSLDHDDFDELDAEAFENIHNLFAAILAREIGRQLKQGLYREYTDHRNNVTAARGKIHMPGTIQNQIARKRVLTCEYDELSENILLNQILKTTVLLLLRNDKVDQIYKAALKKEMLFFSSIEIIDPSTIRWASIRFHRNNISYRMPISICQLLMEGFLMTTEEGGYKLAPFIKGQTLDKVYEKFILQYYNKECKQVKAAASKISWALDNDISTMLPTMQSDITLKKKGQNGQVLIIDAKFYASSTQEHFDVHTQHSANMYQIFTYVKNKDAEFKDEPHKVSGMLLYAATDDDIQPDNVYQMSGNQISVKTLDMNCDFADIAKQLDDIADDHFETKQI